MMKFNIFLVFLIFTSTHIFAQTNSIDSLYQRAMDLYNTKSHKSYVNTEDSCQTIIHELFHLLHLKQINLSGNIVEYLDNYEARILLRTEFEALRNCLKAIQNKNDASAMQFLSDAIYFRKERETKFNKQNKYL